MYGIHRFCFKNFFIRVAWIFYRIGKAVDRASSWNTDKCSDLYGNQFFYFISNALWFQSGVSCRKQHYLRCWIPMQWCDL